MRLVSGFPVVGRALPWMAFLLFAVATVDLLLAQETVAPATSPGGNEFLAKLLTWPEIESEADDEEESPLESDRPDFTECSTTVGYRVLQIESGYTYTHAPSGDSTADTHDLPELLLRYGIAERLELRIAWDEGIVFDRYLDHDTERIVSQSGSTDLSAGFKYALTKQNGWRPRSALIVACTLPVGSYAHSSRQVDAGVNFLYSWELSEHLALNCSTGNTCTRESEDFRSQVHQSASFEYELTKRLSVYNEWFALFHVSSDDNRPQHYYDGGFTFLVAPNFQLDWRAGAGLSAGSDAFFTGCGFTIRR